MKVSNEGLLMKALRREVSRQSLAREGLSTKVWGEGPEQRSRTKAWLEKTATKARPEMADDEGLAREGSDKDTGGQDW